MRVLISVASKHGATDEIGAAIGRTLTELGHNVDSLAPSEVRDVAGYDTVILGSAVYAGRWRRDARDLVAGMAEAWQKTGVWLFSSGPLGDPPQPSADPVDITEISERTGARDHRVFAGKLDPQQLSFGERAIVAALHAPAGDFRDWEDIRRWAESIAAQFKSPD